MISLNLVFEYLFVDSILEVTAPSPKHALSGSKVHLRCTFSVAKPPINPLFLAVLWYFQDTEILRYDNKGLSIRPGVSFSTEAANNGDVSLSLANVTISDGGIYKCLVIYSPEKMEMNVLLEIFVPPVIFIPNKVIQKNKKNTLICTANGFYPEDIDISWYKDNEPLTNSELGKQERNPDGTYRVMGTVTLPPMDGKMDHNFSCRVQHVSLQEPLQEDFMLEHISITWTCEAGDSQGRILSREEYEENPDLTFSVCSEARISGDKYKDPAFRVGVTWEHGSLDAPGYREFSVQNPDYPWDPIVEPIQETKFLHNSPTSLQCNISEYFPDALTVTWLRKGAESEELTEVPNTPPYIRSNKQTDNTYSCTPCLIIYPSLRDQGTEYICRVTHPSLVRPIDTSTGTINVMAKPMFLDPVQMDLLPNDRVQFSIILRNFYPRDIHINWSQGERQDKVTEQEDLTYDVTSVCIVPGGNFTDPKYKVHVTWNHVTMEAPESRDLWVTDFPWRPQVGEILVPTLGKKKVTLSCKISGYFPDVLTVSWFRMEKSDQSETSLTDAKDFKPTSLKQEDQTFTCDTSLIFTPNMKTDQGAEFICRVRHPSLEQLIERRTGTLVIPE
ncbi:hypothetical protein XELAEV_18003416mg [Xenopus laevis]|nr:hypothetical protein XELAEV_18003416mg [Xenopus laevis]